MAGELTASDRSRLRQRLLEQFELSELKDFAFELGAAFHLFTRRTSREMSRDLINHFDQRDQIACLVKAIAESRPDEYLQQLLGKLPECGSLTKALLILSESFLVDLTEVLEGVARECQIEPNQVAVVGAARGTLRLLLSLPASADLGALSTLQSMADGRYRVENISSFDSMELGNRQTWRAVVIDWPPIRRGQELRATIGWEEALEKSADVNRLQRLLGHLAVGSSEFLITYQDFLDLEERFPGSTLDELLTNKVSGFRRAVRQSSDLRQIGLFEFHAGLIMLHYERFADAAIHFSLARDNWQFDDDLALQCLARFAEGVAHHHEYNLSAAGASYVGAERILGRIRYGVRGPRLTSTLADHPAFVADLTGQLEQAQKTLRSDMLHERPPIIQEGLRGSG